jgi:hypothetical protein
MEGEENAGQRSTEEVEDEGDQEFQPPVVDPYLCTLSSIFLFIYAPNINDLHRPIREAGTTATAHAEERHLRVPFLQFCLYAEAGTPALAGRVHKATFLRHPLLTPCLSAPSHSETEVVIHALSAAMEKVPCSATRATMMHR